MSSDDVDTRWKKSVIMKKSVVERNLYVQIADKSHTPTDSLKQKKVVFIHARTNGISRTSQIGTIRIIRKWKEIELSQRGENAGWHWRTRPHFSRQKFKFSPPAEMSTRHLCHSVDKKWSIWPIFIPNTLTTAESFRIQNSEFSTSPTFPNWLCALILAAAKDGELMPRERKRKALYPPFPHRFPNTFVFLPSSEKRDCSMRMPSNLYEEPICILKAN